MSQTPLTPYQVKHKIIIEAANGIVEDIFVLKTGVLLTKRSKITPEAKVLFDTLNIDTDRPEYEQHAEFNSRITYLSFKDKKGDSKVFNERMIHEYQHRSVYNDEYVTFLIAGCAIETELEFLAHNEATVARLTSSRTNAQNTPLFKIINRGNNQELVEKQKEICKTYVKEKKLFETSGKQFDNEVSNILAPGNKAVSFTITMSVKDWHKTLIGRLSHEGVETDMLLVLEDIATQLKSNYPVFFNTVDQYYKMGNGLKYEGE
ncbi:hypothetical protein [Aquimarina sediminis]|uniref:hypothetical protein n=1 Tax=Aquimarina sediminis TaxID=2070536 RepID=UPI000CA0155D|nr:hypothetical protein [Aquimarina sediminis]